MYHLFRCLSWSAFLLLCCITLRVQTYSYFCLVFQNPSKPQFNHYLFEGICCAVRYVHQTTMYWKVLSVFSSRFTSCRKTSSKHDIPRSRSMMDLKLTPFRAKENVQVKWRFRAVVLSKSSGKLYVIVIKFSCSFYAATKLRDKVHGVVTLRCLKKLINSRFHDLKK